MFQVDAVHSIYPTRCVEEDIVGCLSDGEKSTKLIVPITESCVGHEETSEGHPDIADSRSESPFNGLF